MALSRTILAGVVATVAILLFAVLFFFQYKDPFILVFSVPMLLTLWVVLLIVHVLRHGIPVRVVGDEPKR